MPRRQFVNDLQNIRPDSLPHGIHSLEQGEDDGQFTFTFAGDPNAPMPQPVTVTALITDLDEYPKSHEYMLFSDDDAPLFIGAALQDVRGTARKPVIELIGIVSAALTKAAPDKDGDTEMEDSQGLDDEESLEEEEEDDAQDDIYDSDHEAFGGSASVATSAYQTTSSSAKIAASSRNFRSRIRSDLITAKRAGFKVGQVGHLMEGLNCFVSISIRMSKLGISHEAMQAWQVRPEEYLVLIIQYPNGYKTSEELQALDSLRLAPNIGFRVCASKHYKPTLQEAIQAFTVVSKTDSRENVSSSAATNAIPQSEDTSDGGGLRETFISKPLNSLLQERLVPILRSRAIGMTWRGAEGWYVESASRGPSNADGIPDAFFEPEPLNDALPDIVNADHHAYGLGEKSFEKSFPLLAMQFLLRHFVRCTDFCLVCHRPLETEVEAIKPYVCDQPLCLYQYMTLGFGPSIEHEILSQPYVVDLLISFCYASTAMRRLKDLPDGLALMVPPINPSSIDIPDQLHVPLYRHAETTKDSSETNKASCSNCLTYEVGLDPDKLEMIFHDKPERCPVRRGSWIVFKASGFRHGEMHCRVADVTYYPTIKIDTPVTMTNRKSGDSQGPADITWATSTTSGASTKTITPAATPKWINATFQVYEQDFEDLTKHAKCIAICRLLDTLPNVKCMQEYLSRNRPTDLKSWVDRVSPAALSLLRWIIASNRACIMQVDGDTAAQDADRVSGMKGYMQFRFAMGAPDKEQRFLTAIRDTKERLGLQYPTIFAWHGSPLHNWHMIIREGLHYKNVDHGRAYGDGVYHAKDASTSVGYSGMQYYSQGGTATSSAWPQSLLRINSALAMNEIANAPAEFQSSHPFYVVQNLDWIQTRYLFVQCNPVDDVLKDRLQSESTPRQIYQQDPSRTPIGTGRDRIEIPASAVKVAGSAKTSGKKGRGIRSRENGQSPVKRLKGNGGFADPIAVDETDDSANDTIDDSASDTTDPDDAFILLDKPESEPESDEAKTVAGKTKNPVSKAGDTDFLPGALDYGTLPLMPVPEYAISGTTKRLLKELQHLQKVQQSSTLADLGWYIDVDKIENVYQWIVELHSFHCLNPKLPIVTEMKNKGMKSIVLEIRFNKDFPYTPPYVRVVRPRFLTFAQGGGGHIVMGGAMCMELLTNTGWSSVSSMESVLMQVRLAIALSEPPAKLDVRAHGDYGTGEAADGYVRACATHGWTVPPGFKEMAYGMGRKRDY